MDIELNGIANIASIIRMAREDGKISKEVAIRILDQLDALERYMVALSTGQVPEWCDVVQNRFKYKNNRGKYGHKTKTR